MQLILARDCYQKYCVHTLLWVLFDKKLKKAVASSKFQYITVPIEA